MRFELNGTLTKEEIEFEVKEFSQNMLQLSKFALNLGSRSENQIAMERFADCWQVVGSQRSAPDCLCSRMAGELIRFIRSTTSFLHFLVGQRWFFRSIDSSVASR
jgi:hypothetical protein